MSLQKLQDDASDGMDLSPGDPVAKWALSTINNMRAVLKQYLIHGDIPTVRANAEMALSRLMREPPHCPTCGCGSVPAKPGDV